MARKGTRAKIGENLSVKKAAHGLLAQDDLRASKDATDMLADYARQHGSKKASEIACIARQIAKANKRKTVKGRDIAVQLGC